MKADNMETARKILQHNGVAWHDSDKGAYLKLIAAMNEYAEQAFNAARERYWSEPDREAIGTYRTWNDYLNSLK